MIKPHQTVAAARLARGLSERELADSVGLSVDGYCDLERDPAEFQMVVPIGIVSRLCAVLRLDIYDLYGVQRPTPESPTIDLRARRMQKGMSVEQVAQLVGIETAKVQEVEKNPHAIAGWVMDPVEDLARTLDVEVQRLIALVN